MKKRPFLTYSILFLILGLPIAWLFINKISKHTVARLPIEGERYVGPDGDTVYHKVAKFMFINQDGQVVTDKDYDSCIYVANFFFASCKDVCPKMNTNMMMVYNHFRNTPGVCFLSHTIDPENDSIPVLKEYARKLQAEAPKWNFVRGPESAIYRAAHSYLIVAAKEDSVMDHSWTLTLVDRDKRVRGHFDGLNYAEMQKLNDAIKALLIEYKVRYKPE
jgi:protein SCO1